GELNIQLRRNAFSYEVKKLDASPASGIKNSIQSEKRRMQVHRVDVEFEGADNQPEIIAGEKSKDYTNYYTTGTGEKGYEQVYQYGRVLYKNIYPLIDIEFNIDGQSGQFKYNFIVHPGGDLDDIQIRYRGAETNLDGTGEIAIATIGGTIKESIPESYEIGGKTIIVEYAKVSKDLYRLATNSFDHSKTLVVDPWATYFGEYYDRATDLTADSSSNLYLTGQASSNNLATAGAYQTTIGSANGDAFIAKFNKLGGREWTTYFGGEDSEYGNSIAVDSSRNIYISGITTSITNIATPGAFQVTTPGNDNAFLAKFNQFGFRQWGTYYGLVYSNAWDVATAPDGSIVLCGHTEPDPSLITAGAYQT
ncbi:MAG: hypothetical protein EOP49_49205, partial [Sphingobacteriales bacterium]